MKYIKLIILTIFIVGLLILIFSLFDKDRKSIHDKSENILTAAILQTDSGTYKPQGMLSVEEQYYQYANALMSIDVSRVMVAEVKKWFSTHNEEITSMQGYTLVSERIKTLEFFFQVMADEDATAKELAACELKGRFVKLSVAQRIKIRSVYYGQYQKGTTQVYTESEKTANENIYNLFHLQYDKISDIGTVK